MGDILVVALLIVCGVLYGIGLVLYAGMQSLYRRLSGKTRREKERKQRLSEAKAAFERALLNGQFPPENVLAVLEDENNYRDIDGNCDDAPIPERLWRRYGRCPYPDAVKQVRKDMQACHERRQTAAEFGEVVHEFAGMAASCDRPWDELMHTLRALGGDDFQSSCFADAVKHDVVQALATACVANGGGVPESIGRLCQAVVAQVKPDEYLTIDECRSTLGRIDRKSVTLPVAIRILSQYPTMLRRPSSAHTVVASAYCSLMVAASWCFPYSAPASAVAALYFDLLKPYLAGQDSSGAASGNGRGNGSANRFTSSCGKCAKYYPILRLERDATEEEIKAAHRDLTQIYHPDRFEGKGERVRRMAEERLKEVNEAYTHVISHFEAKRQTA